MGGKRKNKGRMRKTYHFERWNVSRGSNVGLSSKSEFDLVVERLVFVSEEQFSVEISSLVFLCAVRLNFTLTNLRQDTGYLGRYRPVLSNARAMQTLL